MFRYKIQVFLSMIILVSDISSISEIDLIVNIEKSNKYKINTNFARLERDVVENFHAFK